MTLEDLHTLRQDTEVALNNMLKYKPHRLPSTTITRIVDVMFSSSTTKDIKLLQQKIKVFKPDRITSYKIEKAYHGWSEVIGTKYTLVKEVQCTVITDKLVKEKTMRAVANIIKKDTNGKYSYFKPKCEVMELFKKGKITWDDVLEAHINDCEI